MRKKSTVGALQNFRVKIAKVKFSLYARARTYVVCVRTVRTYCTTYVRACVAQLCVRMLRTCYARATHTTHVLRTPVRSTCAHVCSTCYARCVRTCVGTCTHAYARSPFRLSQNKPSGTRLAEVPRYTIYINGKNIDSELCFEGK